MTLVWVEPVACNDLGFSGRAELLEDRGAYCDVRMLDCGMALSVPREGVIALPCETETSAV